MTAPRRILLTGASSGIGFQAAVRLCRAGHRLVLPCRDGAMAAATAARVAEVAGGEAVPLAPVCDLADLESVEDCAAALLRSGEPLDGLTLNAGLQYAGAPTPRRSAQGFELTFAVNHLAHQLLAQRLAPLLEAGDNPRLVVTASEVHDPSTPGGRVGRPAGLGALSGLRAGAGFGLVDGSSPFDAEKAYKDSKLAGVLLAREFERRQRLRGRPLAVIAWSPGLVIPRSSGGFFRYSRTHNEWGQRLFALVARDLLRFTETPQNAGAHLARLATDPAWDGPGFTYLSNRIAGPGRLRLEAVAPSGEALDDALARELWEITAALVGAEGEPPAPKTAGEAQLPDSTAGGADAGT